MIWLKGVIKNVIRVATKPLLPWLAPFFLRRESAAAKKAEEAAEEAEEKAYKEQLQKDLALEKAKTGGGGSQASSQEPTKVEEKVDQAPSTEPAMQKGVLQALFIKGRLDRIFYLGGNATQKGVIIQGCSILAGFWEGYAKPYSFTGLLAIVDGIKTRPATDEDLAEMSRQWDEKKNGISFSDWLEGLLKLPKHAELKKEGKDRLAKLASASMATS